MLLRVNKKEIPMWSENVEYIGRIIFLAEFYRNDPEFGDKFVQEMDLTSIKYDRSFFLQPKLESINFDI